MPGLSQDSRTRVRPRGGSRQAPRPCPRYDMIEAGDGRQCSTKLQQQLIRITGASCGVVERMAGMMKWVESRQARSPKEVP